MNYRSNFYLGRPQDVMAAMKIYHQEADKQVHKANEINVGACNSLGKIYLDGKYVPRDLKKVGVFVIYLKLFFKYRHYIITKNRYQKMKMIKMQKLYIN